MQETQELRFDSWVRKVLWRKKWQPTPVLSPGKSHGQRILVGYSSRGCKDKDMTENWAHEGRLDMRGRGTGDAKETARFLASYCLLESGEEQEGRRHLCAGSFWGICGKSKMEQKFRRETGRLFFSLLISLWNYFINLTSHPHNGWDR